MKKGFILWVLAALSLCSRRVDDANIIWDCETKDYWRKEERHVTSWKNAGEGGIYHLGYYDIFDGKPCL